MQLKKQRIRNTSTYRPVLKNDYGRIIDAGAPYGIHRHPMDFNQVNNHEQVNRNKFGDTFRLDGGRWVSVAVYTY